MKRFTAYVYLYLPKTVFIYRLKKIICGFTTNLVDIENHRNESNPADLNRAGKGGAMSAKIEITTQSPASKLLKKPEIKPVRRPLGSKVKTSISLSVESLQRLSIHATMMNMDKGELMEQLIRDHLKRFVVSDRGGSGTDEPLLIE